MNDGGPAFPHLRAECQTSHETEMYIGLTKRELFSAMAMQGWVSTLLNDDVCLTKADPDYYRVSREHFAAVAEWAVGYADALIGALKEEPK
jgi:hypothetical protein